MGSIHILFNNVYNCQIDQKESEIEQENEVKDVKPITIEFIQHKDEEQKDELLISFKLLKKRRRTEK